MLTNLDRFQKGAQVSIILKLLIILEDSINKSPVLNTEI